MIEKLTLLGDKFLPSIDFDAKKNQLDISGYSIPEDAKHFYSNLIIWTESYFKQKPKVVKLNFNFVYFNSSSSKYIFELLKVFQKAEKNGVEVNVTWRYEEDDEDMLESGQTYQQLTNLPFEFIAI